MPRKIVIALAPTSGKPAMVNNPVRSQAIATDVINCARAGASVVHLHARDEQGRLTTDLTAFNKAVQVIKDSCDIILEASTGGLSDLTPEERALPAGNPHAEIASLNIGSVNFGDLVYQNGMKDVRYWLKVLAEKGAKPSLEVFDTGNIESARQMISEGLVRLPCNFGFVFGLKWGMVYHPAILAYLKSRVPEGSNWGADFFDSTDFSQHLDAAQGGATILRVGFEDSNQYNGKIAASNAELVIALREELETAGFSIATTAEARTILGLESD
jgi:3-keto-5-aminohexanoate cleavage enzyme